MLVTSAQSFGVNGREDEGLARSPTWTARPLLEELLVGEAEDPTGGVKGAAREAWLLVRDGPVQPL